MEQNPNKKSKFNIGVIAFEKISFLLNKVTYLGHKTRRKYREKDIIDYLGIIETAYIPLKPIFSGTTDDKDIEQEIVSLKKNIDVFNRRVSGDKIKLVIRLTELEKKLYIGMQKLKMYIVEDYEKERRSNKRDLMEHLQGSTIPELDDDEDLDI